MMEPDIIRMYSSSPPPLDNGAEEDEEEEFGDFGGFAGAGSSNVGFDFASDYSGSIAEHKSSYNSDYSGNVGSIIAFTTAQYANDKENITELPNSIKQLPDRENCECKHFDTSFDEDSPIEVKRSGKPESSYPEIIRTDMKVSSQDQQVNSCNGERQPCRAVLTNGFVASDTANSQGVEDLDSISDSKGFKIISTHITELNLDSIASTADDFADFATFSSKQTTQVEETGNKICKNSSETEVLSVQENNIRNRVGGRESMKEATLDGICEYEGETSTEGERINIPNTNFVIADDLKAAEVRTAFEHNFVSSIKTNVNSVGTTESTEVKGECDSGNSKEHTVFQTNDTAKTLNFNINRVHSLSSLPAEEKVHASETIRNSESCTEHPSCSESSEDDFGDFGTVSNGLPAFTDGAQASTHQEHFQVTNDSFSKLSYECDDFTDSDVNQQSTEIEPPQSNAISSTELEEHLMSASHSGMKMPSPADVENRDDSEFGDFGSMAKRLPDLDDFSDFSAAGCNQTVEWNAFEPEQQESCIWADFEEQPVVESHPGRDMWPSHRTGSTSSTESSLTQNVCITSLHGTGNEQLHELPASARTALLLRLERIFEACFPSVPVSEMEEEIVPLTLLLEMCNKPERTEETVMERELFDVWTEIQDIHDAYGLRYQWGGSHNNKKLLCSLGIDTRNILFTGNKKQPVIVPMYAAGLGMLEPTKEPLKPLSAAEKIASLGQTPTVSSEMNICAPDQSQESLPPVQFDWSSSGLTNPLDASGGSTLLNLDFFGPVDDSSSSTTTTIPGVDPELYELTTSKLETSNTTSKVTDAFAKLMSTVEKATSSARKPKKEEQLSEEAAKVISSLPDLSFMHAKVLMFPATLTPSTSCQAKVD